MTRKFSQAIPFAARVGAAAITFIVLGSAVPALADRPTYPEGSIFREPPVQTMSGRAPTAPSAAQNPATPASPTRPQMADPGVAGSSAPGPVSPFGATVDCGISGTAAAKRGTTTALDCAAPAATRRPR
jgi:hypothetical protein